MKTMSHSHRLKERQLLLKAAFRALSLRDLPLEMSWEYITQEMDSPNWEIYPILWYGVKNERLSEPPPATGQALEYIYLLSEANSQMQILLLDNILLEAENKGLMVCLLKGVLFLKELYPDIALRPMGDIDILVPDHSKKEMRKILEDFGGVYKTFQGTHERYVFHDLYDTVIEVHFRLVNIENTLQRFLFPSDFLNEIPWDVMVDKKSAGLRLPFDVEYNYHILHALKEGFKSLKWIIDKELIDAQSDTANVTIHNRFIDNARTMIQDVTAVLIGEKKIDDLNHLFWHKSVQHAALGKAGKWERLLMAIACYVN